MGVLLIANFLMALFGVGAVAGGIGSAELALQSATLKTEKAKLEKNVAELEREKLESVSTIARLELEKRILTGENTQLRNENMSMREQLAAARQQHQALVTSGAKISKDTQADLEDYKQWVDKKLKAQADEVDNTNIARWHEKTEYGKKLAEYQRLLRRAAAEAGGLNKKLAAKEAELATVRDELKNAQSKLATAKQDLDIMKQTMQRSHADQEARHKEELKRYRLAVIGLVILFAATLIALIFVLLRRRTP